MKHNNIYIIIMTAVLVVFTVVFATFPRSTFSELEKRELARFPEFSFEKLKTGEFTKDVSAWFSDSEPYRDVFMQLSMLEKDVLGISAGEDNVTFHASADDVSGGTADDAAAPGMTPGEYVNNVTADDNAKIANKGIIITGKGDKVRALMAYGGSPSGGVYYAKAANAYKQAFGTSVRVYCMVIPTAVAYYCPDKARKCTNEEWPTIKNIHSHLAPDVKPVDAFTVLGAHADEDIFLRTDHHWAPLGAFYAAQEFARVAGVPFKPLSSYQRMVVRGYVGSMYGYSKDISIKRAPEDFVYYVPKGAKYTTTYTDYVINSNYQVVSEGKPHKGIFFYKYRDGSGGAYCTFMGGDTRITKVSTGVRNGRRVMILKDSFGNAMPGYLFYSFEEVHVVDYRYFTKNMKAYVRDNKITDILFANNIFNAYSKKTCDRYIRFLNQRGGEFAQPDPKGSVTTAADSAAHAGAVKAAPRPEHPAVRKPDVGRHDASVTGDSAVAKRHESNNVGF